jgi:death-on-curing protein
VTDEPKWISRTVADAIHEQLRQQHGGNVGVLTDGSIESALSRPQNRFADTGAELFECAAYYVFGLAKNHGYQDANKCTAYMTAWTFLRINGVRVNATPEDVIRLMLDVATDALAEPATAEWLKIRAVQL